MSTMNETKKNGHPVAGIVLSILGIGVAVLFTLLFGIAAGIVFSSTVIGLIRPILHRRHFGKESAAPEDKK